MSDLSASSGTPEGPSPLEILQSSIDETLSQIQALKTRRAALASSILSSNAARSLQHDNSTLSKTLQTHDNRNLTKIYRLCASATLFESHDPSPHAPDAGRVLGIRIELFSTQDGSRKYLAPAYLMLHKPFSGTDELRVLKHTLPPAVPLQDLISQFLPSSQAAEDGSAGKSREQDVPGLVRALRKEVVSLQRRKDALRRLGNSRSVKAVKSLDAEERDWKISWQGGGYARLKVSKSGEIQEAVIMTENGKRDRKRERRLLDARRVERLEGAIRGDT